jgi:hypothetical protein
MEQVSIFHSEDICFEISKYLRVIEILVLTRVPGWQFKVPSGWFKKQVQLRLAERGHPATFLDAINESRSLVSGSFLLSVLDSIPNQDVPWTSNDIDIYTSEAQGPCVHCGKSFGVRTRLSDVLCNCKARAISVEDPYATLKIVCQRNWELNMDLINEIAIAQDVKCLKTFVFDTFDFDFCKVIYDGKTLSVANPESLIKRNCIYYGDKEALKYAETTWPLEERLIRINKTYDIRQKKYEGRGFHVENQFDLGNQFRSMMITNDKMDRFTYEFTKLLANYGVITYKMKYDTNSIKGRIHPRDIINTLNGPNRLLFIEALKCIDYKWGGKMSLLGLKIKSMLNNCFPKCTFEYGSSRVDFSIGVRISLMERITRPKGEPIYLPIIMDDSD